MSQHYLLRRKKIIFISIFCDTTFIICYISLYNLVYLTIKLLTAMYGLIYRIIIQRSLSHRISRHWLARSFPWAFTECIGDMCWWLETGQEPLRDSYPQGTCPIPYMQGGGTMKSLLLSSVWISNPQIHKQHNCYCTKPLSFGLVCYVAKENWELPSSVHIRHVEVTMPSNNK